MLLCTAGECGLRRPAPLPGVLPPPPPPEDALLPKWWWWCGSGLSRPALRAFTSAEPNADDTMLSTLELVLLVLLCVCTWWILRTDETDDDVDLRPRSPADPRRYEDRGVSGAGDSEGRGVNVDEAMKTVWLLDVRLARGVLSGDIASGDRSRGTGPRICSAV